MEFQLQPVLVVKKRDIDAKRQQACCHILDLEQEEIPTTYLDSGVIWSRACH